MMGDEANCSYNQCFVFTLDGPLRVESLRAALEQVVALHDGLRAVIAADGSGQTILPPFAFELPVLDLSALDREVQQRELEAVATAGMRRRPSTSPRARSFARSSCASPPSATCSSSPRITSSATDGRRPCSSRTSGGSMPPIASVSRRSSTRPRPIAQYVAGQTAPAVRAARRPTRTTGLAQYADGAPSWTCRSPEPARDEDLPQRPRGRCGSTTSCTPRSSRPAATSRATLFATLLAAFEVLVYRISGQSDFVVGMPFAGQPQLENPRSSRIASTPFRCEPASSPARPFSEHLRTVRDELAEAQDHSRITFGSLVRRLQRRPRPQSHASGVDHLQHRQDRRAVRLRRRDHRLARARRGRTRISSCR